MYSQDELSIILAIGVVLIFLGASMDIYWILNGWQINAIRRAFARWVRRWVESYVKGLRRLAEDES